MIRLVLLVTVPWWNPHLIQELAEILIITTILMNRFQRNAQLVDICKLNKVSEIA